MIPTLMEMVERLLGLRLVFVPIVLALFSTGLVLAAPVARAVVRRKKFLKCPALEKGENNMQASLSGATKSSAIRVLLFSIALVALFGSRAFASDPGARVVKYSKEDIVQVHAKLRFSTLIVLPDDEEILDFTTGDREFWIINGSHNLCYVHPAQAGIKSNLNLITASGHVYSFLLAEISGDPNAQPDLKLFVEPKEGTSAGSPLHGYVRAADAEAYRKELADIHQQTGEQIRAAEAHAVEEVNQFRSSYAAKLRFDYLLDAKSAREPFLVSAIYHDDGFTYIRCAAREKPTLYEIKDGKPNLISFQLENGVYIVSKIVDSGYLAVGKKKLTFSRQVAGK